MASESNGNSITDTSIYDQEINVEDASKQAAILKYFGPKVGKLRF